MSGPLCLQGGGEFSAGCKEMDSAFLEQAGGPVWIMALASAPGGEYERATTNGVAHFRRLGAEAYAVPDPRENDVGDIVSGGGLVVLPGGSPSRLVEGLTSTGMAEALRAHVAAGGAVMGASAGAMVLGSWTVLPEEGPRVVPGLGLAKGLVVVPHWRGARDDWLAVIKDGTVLGIPEESGVIVHEGRITAVGRRAVRRVQDETDLSVGDTMAAP